MNTFFKAACVAGAALLFAAGSAAARPLGGHAGGGHIAGGNPGGFRASPGPSIRMSPGPSIRMSPGVPRMGFRANGGVPRIHSDGIRSGGFRAGPRIIQGNPGVVHIPRGIKHAYVPGSSHRPHIGKPWNKHHGRHHHRRHGRIFLYAAPYYDDYYYDSGYAGDDCSWLWRRYLATGLKKWKYRYYQCIE